jgi:electron transport complex protein RnfG
MKEVLRFAATLTFVTLFAAGVLSWVNEITKPKILTQQGEKLQKALVTVLPGAEQKNIVPITSKGKILYYKGYSDPAKSELVGYGFLVLSQGYSSTIRTLVGLDATGKILAIKILSQQETPGLGTRCEEIRSGETEPWWQAQFKEKHVTQLVLIKDGGSIESITGATITSQAITEGIAQKARSLLQLIKEKNSEK